MAAKSITRRWARNSLSVILIALILIALGFSIGMRRFYYDGVRQVLNSHANTVSGILTRPPTENPVNFSEELRRMIENSEDKDKFEITAIDSQGRVVLSSSGFSYSGNISMPDYETARRSSDGMGAWVGRSPTGEKVMAVTLMLPGATAEYTAIRFAVSLELVDQMLLVYLGIVLFVMLAIIACVMISGFYFIKSIVIPVREVGAAARRFAAGDMSLRITKKNDDELGELCDVINYMAEEITVSEGLKNEFISSVSHELRTPLTAIKGWSETLLALEDSETDRATRQRGLSVIDRETERLSAMVEELLDFSRIQNGRLTLIREKLDILAELGEAVLIYTERARRDGIELRYEEPERLPPVYGDKNRLRQVFINIIDNALKYSDAGDSVAVTARAEGGWLLICVADTGCGIAPEDLPKVKTKFYKANHTRRGSGIGLAVANEIVQMHGGELTLESELSRGTTVTIRLPEAGKKPPGHPRPELDQTQEFQIVPENPPAPPAAKSGATRPPRRGGSGLRKEGPKE